MKTGSVRCLMLALILAGGLGSGAFDAMAELEVSAAVSIHAATDFTEPLEADGTWVETGAYGRCWHPAGVAAGWHPYCDGTWVWTDCGWYWESDEPWAWACYHYGTWAYDADYGWVWIPGVEWAPAWVYWRIGDGYIGWAPCSPRGEDVDSRTFVFVEERHFQDRHRLATVVVNNPTLLKRTRRIAGSGQESRSIGDRRQAVFVDNGPAVSVVEKATGRKFTAISIQEADRHTRIPSMAKHWQTESAGPAPERHPTSGGISEHPGKPGPPSENPPRKHKLAPAPPPPEPGPPAGTEDKNQEGQDNGQGRDRGH